MLHPLFSYPHSHSKRTIRGNRCHAIDSVSMIRHTGWPRKRCPRRAKRASLFVCTSIFPVYRLYLCIGAYKNLFWNDNMRPFIGRSYLILLQSPLLPRLRLFFVDRSHVTSSPSRFIGCLGPLNCHLVTARKWMRSIGRVGSHFSCFGEPALNIVPGSTVACGYVPFSLLVRRNISTIDLCIGASLKVAMLGRCTSHRMSAYR